MTSMHLMRGVSAGVLALTLVPTLVNAQQSLPTIEVGGARARSAPARAATSAPVRSSAPVFRPAPVRAAAPSPGPAVQSAQASTAPGFSAEKLKLPIYRQPTGQTFTSIDTATHRNTPLFTAADLLIYSPGMSFKAGNGPRDVGISIRGSGARNGFAVRNIFLMEDGFPVTQPDGLGRADLIDPHAYAGVDVYRGPSSALFGNYANGGAINFRTRSGRDIDGLVYGNEFGSFGYINNYMYAGKAVGDFDIAAFASDVRGQGFITHSQFATQTVNMKAVWSPTPTDRFIFKFIHNQMYNNLSTRLSQSQFYFNPFQRGCGSVFATVSAFCGVVNVPANGLRNPTIGTTADLAGFHRDDRRDILGLRWEHDFDANTIWRTQAVYDDKNIDQPTGAQKGYNDVPSVQASTDITQNSSLFGMPARHWLGFFFGKADGRSETQNTLPFGNGAGGALTQKVDSMVVNYSLRAREELALSPDVTAVLGLAGEFSRLSAHQTAINYQNFTSGGIPRNSFQQIAANSAWWNAAPEFSVTWRYSPQWQVYARASSGYGIPNSGQLFVDQQGNNAANTGLKPQRNTGFDAGATWTPNPDLRVTANLFHEWYQNELLTQTAGAGLRAFTFNAPGSVHRGVEFLADWAPVEGWLQGARLLVNYSYNNQMFTNFTEVLSPPTISATNPAPFFGAPNGTKLFFDRAGYKIPGVAPHEFTVRAGYDISHGDFRGLGAFVQYVYKYSYFMDNGNQLTVPSYGVVDFNLHYDREIQDSFLKNFSAFVSVRNVFDSTYMASANNATNTVIAAGFQNPGIILANQATGLIYAGAPRSIVGGVKFKF